MATVLFGFTVFFSIFVPAVYIAQLFKQTLNNYPPVVFVTSIFLINVIVALVVALILIRNANIARRVPTSIPGAALLWVGGCLYLLPQILRIVEALNPDSSMIAMLLGNATPLLWVARLLLCIGIVRLLLAIKPHPGYEYG